MRIKELIYLLFSLILAFTSQFICEGGENGDYMISDVRIFKETPVWKLALAVREQKTRKIKKMVKEAPYIIDYQEPKYGVTLLSWAVGTEKYQSARALLKSGADPNIATYEGETPLFIAAEFSWVDFFAKKNPKYVKLLLRYGADPNICYLGIPGKEGLIEPGTSPLMISIGTGLKKTKALVEAGADLNYKTKSGTTAAVIALLGGDVLEYAYYLIVEKKAKVTEPFYFAIEPIDPTDLRYPVDLLRNLIFGLNSKEYKMKMEIVDEFARQGVNYWETKIPEHIIELIKKRYPDSWEEYIKKY